MHLTLADRKSKHSYCNRLVPPLQCLGEGEKERSSCLLFRIAVTGLSKAIRVRMLLFLRCLCACVMDVKLW